MPILGDQLNSSVGFSSFFLHSLDNSAFLRIHVPRLLFKWLIPEGWLTPSRAAQTLNYLRKLVHHGFHYNCPNDIHESQFVTRTSSFQIWFINIIFKKSPTHARKCNSQPIGIHLRSESSYHRCKAITQKMLLPSCRTLHLLKKKKEKNKKRTLSTSTPPPSK